MISSKKGTYNMPRDVVSGTLLLAGSLVILAVMILHPEAHDLMEEEHFAHRAHLNFMVHSVALVCLPVLFLGLLGLSRRLGFSHLAIGAMVVYGFGSAAALGAAMTSGFVATELFEQVLRAEGEAREIRHALLDHTGHVIHACATVNVVAWAAAIILWSAAILRSGLMSRAAGAAILLVFLSGHVGIDVHGYGLVIFAQAGWMIWVGILLCRPGPRIGQRHSETPER
jgi:hypothetical protein